MPFDDYVRQHGQGLLRAAYLLTGDFHRAEDLVQTVLANAYRKWRKIEKATNTDAYIRRMLVNAHLDWSRRRSSSERATDLVEIGAGSSPDPADQIASHDELRLALTGLAPRARAVVVLRYFCDLDDASIAEAMGITPGAVRATAARALAALRTDTELQGDTR